MTNPLTRGAQVILIMVPLLLSACVSQTKYDALQAQTLQLHEQVVAEKARIGRLENAITYTVNTDLLFASGSWHMYQAGKHLIAKLASKLAPAQEARLTVQGYTDNVPVGRALLAKGVTSNNMLSQKRAENVMEFLISQGVNPGLVSAQGLGEADPVAPNDTGRGRAKNRRVVLTVARG